MSDKLDERALEAAAEATTRAGQRGDLRSAPVSRAVLEAAIVAYLQALSSAAAPAPMSADTAPAAMPGERELVDLLRASIKVDASGLAPAVVSHYVDGFDDAARAILALAEKDAQVRAGEIMTQKMRELAARQKAAGKEYYDRALAAEAALAAERERCAKVAEELGPTLDGESSWYASNVIAAAIRAQIAAPGAAMEAP